MLEPCSLGSANCAPQQDADDQTGEDGSEV